MSTVLVHTTYVLYLIQHFSSVQSKLENALSRNLYTIWLSINTVEIIPKITGIVQK